MVLIKGGIEEVEVGCAMRWKNMHSVVILTSDVGLKAARKKMPRLQMTSLLECLKMMSQGTQYIFIKAP